jgi:predicted O-methyltransferase YrrM
MLNVIKNQLEVIDGYDGIANFLAGVTGFLKPTEGFALTLLAMHGPGSGAIVEIGSFKGRSTCFLALGAKLAGREKVTAIDHFRGSAEHQKGQAFEDPAIVAAGSTLPIFRTNLAAAGVVGQVNVMEMSSSDAAAAWSGLIRLLFIDGDHSYDATKRDFALFEPHVGPEGIICFHDVGVWPGVTRFYQEVIEGGTWKPCFIIASLAAITRATVSSAPLAVA